MHPAVNSLVAPIQKRPSIWRGGVCQIMITRACDLACHGCTQGSQLGGKPAMMSVEQFEQACDSLQGYFGVVGVFGGNPALHPKFSEICQVMRAKIPFLQRGLWCNALHGKGADARITFNPRYSNINVHLNSEAAEEFRRDWPESAPFIKGIDQDSVHGTPFVSQIDLGIPEEERWKNIADCDISRYWSSLIGVFRGELRFFFCEVAYSMSALHQDNPNWAGSGQPFPDIGLPVTPGCWRKPMADFEQQVLTCCHNCAIPLRRAGQQAINGTHEEFSITHAHIARPKVRDRAVQFVSVESLARTDRPSTQYLPNVTPGYKGD
jgi:hypothetical protein